MCARAKQSHVLKIKRSLTSLNKKIKVIGIIKKIMMVEVMDNLLSKLRQSLEAMKLRRSELCIKTYQLPNKRLSND